MANIIDLIGEHFADIEIVLYQSAGRLMIVINAPSYCIARLAVPPLGDDHLPTGAIELILLESIEEATP